MLYDANKIWTDKCCLRKKNTLNQFCLRAGSTLVDVLQVQQHLRSCCMRSRAPGLLFAKVQQHLD
jgi:hypothetical protein